MSTPCMPPVAQTMFFPGTKGDTGPAGPTGAASTVPGPEGPAGAVGVYTGAYNALTTYYDDANRRDIVFYAGRFWIANNTARTGTATWGVPNVADWADFGASLVLVATKLELLFDANIGKVLNFQSPGLAKSDNFVAAGGVYKGWALNGGAGGAGGTGGDVQFYGGIFAGKVSTDTPKFNLAAPLNTMPNVAVATYPILAIADGAITTTPTINNVTDNALIIFGWLEGAATFLENRFGNTTQKFTINLSGTGMNTSPAAERFIIEIYYRKRTNGGAWDAAWTLIGQSAYVQKIAAVTQSFELTRDLTIALIGDNDIQFSAGFSKEASAVASVAGATITVKAFN